MILVLGLSIEENVLAISKMNENFTLLFYNKPIASQQKGASNDTFQRKSHDNGKFAFCLQPDD
jgi:hypothetical protein